MGNNDVNGLFCVLLLAGLVPSNLSSLVTKSKTYQLLSQGEIRTFAYLFQCHCARFRLTFWTFTTPQVIVHHSGSKKWTLTTLYLFYPIPIWSCTIWWTFHQFASLNSSTHDFVSNLNFQHFTSSNVMAHDSTAKLELSSLHLLQSVRMDEIDYGWVQLP